MEIRRRERFRFPGIALRELRVAGLRLRWLKCHKPVAFCAGLLNAQPLGFYAPSQLVQDARRHGVEVRPVDVTASVWFSTLERTALGAPAGRLGLHMVKGLSEDGGKAIVAARESAPFADVPDFFARVRLSRHYLQCVSQADALRTLAGDRRKALWATLGRTPTDAPLPVNHRIEQQPILTLPTEGQDIVVDYHRLGLTLRRHPLALLRPKLKALRVRSAEEVMQARAGQLIHTGGIVTCRQRPNTASGIIFVTLEDETGYVNVVWSSVAERQRRELLASRFLGVKGTIQRSGEVVHVVAGRLVDYSAMLGELQVASRDFH